MKHFSHEELQDPETEEVVLAPYFGVRLDNLRGACGFAFIVNSCCRTKKRNKAVHGHKKSLHVYDEPAHDTGGTCAIDIKTSHLDDTQKTKLVRCALEKGWSVLIHKTFMHLDTRTVTIGYPQRFLYG